MATPEYLQSLFGFDGQVAVVIGGAGELGGAIARGLAQAGAHVVIADVAEDPCVKRCAEICELGGKASWTLIDVTNRESITAALNVSAAINGKVDCLVNAAGVNFGSNFLDYPEDRWDFIMNINLKGTFNTCQIFGKHMAENGGGSILNFGSVTSLLPLSRVFGYAASKAGVMNLTQNIAQDLALQNVRCNTICPGFFPAEQNRKLLDEQRVANIMGHTPMKRYGEPDELIGAALLLLSKNAGKFITGAKISVDGGFTAAWF
ncbi:MAG: SDR family oxidoreductase [Planctomycetaceae bacterium]|nr:SDR family oxidoreductase [Planctomycetaceae bacterium]MBQ2820715.1 SDR family oxidoreductase [Thermoguttaceae bacterium]